MATYCMSDIHGQFSLFKKMLEVIDFKHEDKLYIIGDIFDRGSDVYKIVKFIQTHPNVYMLKGNHEEMAIDAIHNNFGDWYFWFHKNGGNETYNSFYRSFDDFKDRYQVKDREVCTQKEIMRFCKGLPLYKEIEVGGRKFFLVHAGIDPNRPLKEQTEDDMLWIREEFINVPITHDDFLNKTIIFGHTPTYYMHYLARVEMMNNHDVWVSPIYEDKIGIDGHAYDEYGQLNCLRLEDMKCFSVDHKFNVREYKIDAMIKGK